MDDVAMAGFAYAGATLVLYWRESLQTGRIKLWRLIDELKVTHFGTSKVFTKFARYQLHLRIRLVESQDDFLLEARYQGNIQICFTGPLQEPENVQLASITGGTDILSLFAGGCPILPVHAGDSSALFRDGSRLLWLK